jgi:hypothetical protein
MGADEIARCKPIYEVIPGWTETTVGVTEMDNTHSAQWSTTAMPGFVVSPEGASAALRGVPAVVQISIHGTWPPWLQACARETVGASAPSSITHSTSRLSLRS